MICDLDCNGTRTHNYLVRKRTLNYLAKLANFAEWLSVRLQTKWLWVRVPLQLRKSQIWPASCKEILDIRAIAECRFTLKRVSDIIITYSQIRYTFYCLCHNKYKTFFKIFTGINSMAYFYFFHSLNELK